MKKKETNPSFGLNRRNFVKSSAAAAGGMILTPFAAQAAGYHTSVDDTIKVALVGCGGRGTGAAVQALSTDQNLKLVAMADAFRDRLDFSFDKIVNHDGIDKTKIDVKEEHKFVGFDAYKQAIDMADVVILATSPGFRPIHFDYAVENDKHVFMEKPVATDAAGVRQVLASAEKAKEKKLNVVVGLQRHYQTSYRELMKRVHGGEIGDIVAAQAYWDGGGVWVRERQEGQTEMEYQMRNWYYFNWLCGDHIVEQHIHNLDVINWAKNAYPVKAQGMGGREVRNGKENGEIFDHHFVEFEYEDGTVLSSQCRHIKGCMNRVSEFLIGTKGRATTQGKTMITDLKGNKIWAHRDKDDVNPYQQEHNELFAAVAKGEYKYADAENGAKSTMTAIFGRMATYSGQQLTWDEAINSEITIMPTKFAFDAEPPIMPNADGFYPAPVPGVTKVI